MSREKATDLKTEVRATGFRGGGVGDLVLTRTVMVSRFLVSPAKVAIGVVLATLAFYLIAGWDVGADALDSDTLGMVLQWRLIGNGVVLDHWNLSTPKFLPVVLDGSLFELGGYGAVLARSLLTSALLIALAAAFVHRAAGWQASLAAAGLLVANRATFGSAFGGNSTVLYTTFLLGAALCFLAWPSRRAVIGGLLLLCAASLTRFEGLSYLALAGAALCAVSWRRDRKLALLTVTATAGLIATSFLADLWAPTMLSGELRSGRSVAIEINEQAKRTAEAREGSDAYAQAVARIGEAYPEVALSMLGSLLRPGLLFLVLAVAGCGLLWGCQPRAALIVIVLGLSPIFYCALLHFQGVALFDRFFLPTAVAMTMATAVGFSEAGRRLVSFRSRPAAWTGVTALAAVLGATLAIGGRDIYHHKKGYLSWRAERLREYSQGLARLDGLDLAGKKLLVYGWFYAYTAMALDTQGLGVSHDWEALTGGAAHDRLADFDYLLHGEGDADVDSLFGAMECRVESCRLETDTARFETFWISPSGDFKFFRKGM